MLDFFIPLSDGEIERLQRHNLTKINNQTRIGYCIKCRKSVRIFRSGSSGWACENSVSRKSNKRRRELVTDSSVCSKCKFVPISKSQIEIHHKDRNRKKQYEG